MIYTYELSVAPDYNSIKLAIKSSMMVTKRIKSMSWEEGVLSIEFSATLSESDKLILDSIISNIGVPVYYLIRCKQEDLYFALYSMTWPTTCPNGHTANLVVWDLTSAKPSQGLVISPNGTQYRIFVLDNSSIIAARHITTEPELALKLKLK